MSKRHEPLHSDKVSEKQVGVITLQFPKELAESASLILNVLLDIIPVAESYLEAPLEGKVYLEVLSKDQNISTDPTAGTIRYPISGKEVRSPIIAGELSYQLGRILWYRGSSDANYTGKPPRTPPWLEKAALLQLKYLWFDREEWLKFFRESLHLCQTHKLLSTKDLNKASLNPQNTQLARAQCLLRGYSITQRFPNWYSQLSRVLSIDFDLSGEEGLEALTSTNIQAWEELFLTDIKAWSQVSDLGNFLKEKL